MPATKSLHTVIVPGSAEGPILVLLHGRGSDESDLLPIGQMLHPGATTVSVRATFEAAPWGYGPGFAWYRFLGGTTPDAETFESGQQKLHQLMEELPIALKRPDATFVIGGFSQGATSSLAYLMRHPGSVRGVMMFSGFVANHPSAAPTPERVGTTPIFWGHGTSDLAVPFSAAEAGWESLRAAGAALDAHRYVGMPHTISDAELRDARTWLEKIV